MDILRVLCTRSPKLKRGTGITAAISSDHAETVSELFNRYLKDLEAGNILTRRGQSKKASTTVTDRGRIERHIKPLLGALKVNAVTHQDVKSFMRDVASRQDPGAGRDQEKAWLGERAQGTATRTMGLLDAIFAYGHLNPNPVHGVRRYADGKKTRRLSPDEYKALGNALKKAEADNEMWPAAIATIKFLNLTG